MEPHISLITLGVSDLERATRFYENCLGLPQLETPPAITFFEFGKTWLALWSRESRAGVTASPGSTMPQSQARGAQHAYMPFALCKRCSPIYH